MSKLDLPDYYIKNRHEFMGEAGHKKLLDGLKRFIPSIDDTKHKVIGIDVGCCIGNYLPEMQDLCSEKNKQILCFEPNPVNLLALEPKIDQNDCLKLFKCCVSNETGRTSFYNWKGSGSNDTGNEIAGLRGGGKKICDIDVKKLDDVIGSVLTGEDIIIKFVKIDTEGNDGNVIKGLQKYLMKTKYIVFECSDCLDDCRGPGIINPMEDIVSFLSSNGFDTYRIGTKKLFKVNDEYWHPVYDKVKFWSNCFALKKDDNLISKLVDEDFNYKY